jgi:hypothetical protein
MHVFFDLLVKIGHVPYTLLTTIIYKEASLPEIPEPTYKGPDSVKSFGIERRKKTWLRTPSKSCYTVGVK